MKLRSATLILIALTVAISVRAQEPEIEVLRISTNLVTVPVSVKTNHGGYVPNLRREDFRVYEDGVEQQLAEFETIDKPFTIVLMLDVSDSTKTELSEIQNAAIAFLNQLHADDRAMIVVFDKQLWVLASPTSDRTLLANAIRRARTGGGTAMYDAMDEVIKSRLKEIPGRKAIVVLTDGIDTSSKVATNETNVRAASEQYALIYPIQWDTLKRQSSHADNMAGGGVTYTTPSGEPLRKAYDRATRYLELLAHTSGGRFHYADSLKNLETSFARIAEELRQQYSLGYYPKTPKAGKHKIKVTVNIPDAEAHGRETYVYR